MGSIDADAHVYECDETWKYLPEGAGRYAPAVTTQISGPDGCNIEHAAAEYWVIDSRFHPKNRNIMPGTSPQQRELRDIGARLAHMDELGVDVQVIYPSLFLRPVMRTAGSELALTRSYNSWMETIWKQSPERLRWVVLPAIQSMDENRETIARAKDHGACGIFMRGNEWERFHGDPYLFPLYDLAAEFDMPICIHSGSGSMTQHDHCLDDTSFTKFLQPGIGAFHSLIEKDIPAKFPEVRWGFVELGAQWLPYVYLDLKARLPRFGRRMPEDLLAANNMYVALAVSDDLPYVLRYAGEDNLIIGTDYGHNDQQSRLDAFEALRRRNDVDAVVLRKITDENPRKLYRL